MNLYLKILQFLKPFWKLILVSVFLTFFYVIFNNISLWISVDFIRELFNPSVIESVNRQSTEAVDQAPSAQVEKRDSISDLFGLPSQGNLYTQLNNNIKKFLIQSNPFDTLKIVCLVIFLAFLIKNIILYVRRIINNYIELSIITNIRNKLHHALLRCPLSFFDKSHTGKFTSIVFNDVNAMNTVLNNSFGKLVLTPIQVLTNLVILLLISWKLSLITFTVIPISALLIVKIGQSIRRKSRRVFQQISNVVTAFQEAISAIRIVKAFTNEFREDEKFQTENRKFLKIQYRMNNLSYATSPLNETLGIMILTVLLWYGGNLVYRNQGLEAEGFIRYLVFLFTMFQPLKDLSDLNNVIQNGLAAAERIFGILETEQESYQQKDAVPIDDFEESIVFDHVNFQYDEKKPMILNDISLRVVKGETVAFVGHSGSGKTTLVNLLPRFYDVQNGVIKIDGHDIRRYDLISLRKQMGIVTQDSILFNDTVRFNITYGMDNVPDEDVIAAAKNANAWEFISTMDNKLNSIIGERGVNISGGQKQRLAIARAILKNPPILILDEATSALDTESEKLVQEAIDKLMKNRTVLVIAHRLSTIIHADKIIVMDSGEIVDEGSHVELLKKCSLYRHLYEMQFRDDKKDDSLPQ